MKLLDYLEYMTLKEKEEAGSKGQSNLKNLKFLNKINRKNLIIKKEDEDFLRQKKELLSNGRFDNIKKNKFIKRYGQKVVMTYNGQFVSGSEDDYVHDHLVEYMLFMGMIPKTSVNKYYGRYEIGATQWNLKTSYLSEYICLHYVSPYKPTMTSDQIYLSESYSIGMVNYLKNSELFNHYSDLIKSKLGLELIAETAQ